MHERLLKKGEATRLRIMEAAYPLFLSQGFHGTSIRQIAIHAEITIGGIYAHFNNKEAIWEAVFMLKHPYREIVPLLETVEGDTIAEFTRQATYRLVSELGRRKDLLNIMFIELVEFNGRHIPTLLKEILPHFLHLAEVFNQKSGCLRPASRPVLARSFACLFFAYYFTDLFAPEEIRSLLGKDNLDSFVNIYLYGILDETPEVEHG